MRMTYISFRNSKASILYLFLSHQTLTSFDRSSGLWPIFEWMCRSTTSMVNESRKLWNILCGCKQILVTVNMKRERKIRGVKIDRSALLMSLCGVVRRCLQ